MNKRVSLLPNRCRCRSDGDAGQFQLNWKLYASQMENIPPSLYKGWTAANGKCWLGSLTASQQKQKQRQRQRQRLSGIRHYFRSAIYSYCQHSRIPSCTRIMEREREQATKFKLSTYCYGKWSVRAKANKVLYTTIRLLKLTFLIYKNCSYLLRIEN